jgi:uncharacterized protein YdhG (YjbR/CyaY superfamily)
VRYDTAIRAEEAEIAAPNSVEDYLASLPEEQRAALEKLRMTIKAAAPKATETISYQMPAFKYEGLGLVCYAAFTNHYSLFPMSLQIFEDYTKELEPYRSGRGTIRFTTETPLPTALVRKIVQARMAEIAAAQKRR